ncbi:MAG: DUF1559 domain-containing protein, partial [Planctomycetaceae bacterium]|nr:DUF1559 domain-containing protein [Planctomycetaceae bacterium]
NGGNVGGPSEQFFDDVNRPNPGGFNGPHTGGVQVLLGDGSVRFVSENINPVVLRNLGDREDLQAMGEF